MDTLHRYRRGKKQYFKIYSREEADAAGIKYVPWREAKAGDWALTDDDYVGECLDVQGPYTAKSTKATSRHMVFSFARLWTNPGYELKYLERKVNRSFYRVSIGHWAESHVKNKAAKRFIQAYVMMWLAGNIDWVRLEKIYRPVNRTRKNHGDFAKFLFKQEAFQRMIKEKMVEVFKDKDITEGDVIDMLKTTFDLAKQIKNPNAMARIAEKFVDIFDMLPRPVPTGFQIPPGEDADFEEIQTGIDRAKEALPERKKALPEAMKG